MAETFRSQVRSEKHDDSLAFFKILYHNHDFCTIYSVRIEKQSLFSWKVDVDQISKHLNIAEHFNN